ncbi:hypothetical protein [Mesorhizobium sp. AR10]|uniref:hypothetical protein n=1 Tax=Mesorhizobium sp. AR10 TaxID=2865839 RepID=UPI00215F66DF|nr:hypothetical protein [Mesorhizobium sp. AR10]
MARTLVESSITTRNARAALEIGIHWRGIDPEVHLGYRKGKRGGAWLVRWRCGRGYRQSPLGTADDELQAGTLSYEAARKAARVLVEGARIEVAATAGKPALDVRHVVEDHISMRDARESKREGRAVRSDASRRLARHILGQPGRGKQLPILPAPLASISLYSLKESDLLAWREALPVAMKFATRQRLINDLKSALNGAYATHRERLDPMLPAVIKHGLKLQHEDDELAPVARENQILSDETIGRLLTAARDVDLEQEWDGDLFRLMVILAATGARFSQIQRMRVADCQAAGGRLLVPCQPQGPRRKDWCDSCSCRP